MLTEREGHIWAAGLFEGEGTISVCYRISRSGERRVNGISLSVTQAHPEVLTSWPFLGAVKREQISKSIRAIMQHKIHIGKRGEA